MKAFRHLLHTGLRLIPLRLKERLNRLAGRPLFNLTFYLQFQPASLENTGITIRRLPETPTPGTRRRIAFITPHLGPGGAEKVFLEMAHSLNRDTDEIFLMATHSTDSRWAAQWSLQVDHVYDLAARWTAEDLPSALYSLILNWNMDTIVVQNTMVGYSVIPFCKKELPHLRVIDVTHAVGERWDITSATAAVAKYIDTRIVISEAGKKHLTALGTGAHQLRLIRNGVDLERFRPAPIRESGPFRILFAARLDPVKRPVLLAAIARALSGMRPALDFRFIVAGNGPEEPALRKRIRAYGVEHLFELRGHVEDMAPLFLESDILLVTSSNEGIPLAIVEAFATARPVVASRAGAIEEAVDENTGRLIERDGDEAAAFARALAGLLDDPGLRRRLGAEARSRAESLYNRHHALQLYKEVLAAPLNASAR
ncbi:MAG: glycosyltransferase family 4 protein [Acidobacteriota bacterium]|nr:glycosyltransferase family 4 protein [Acidobacteriota bacterium]